MKAIVQERYGSPDILQVREVPTPTPGPGEVLVKVMAASLNARDWHALRGDLYLSRLTFGLRRPKEPVLGTDFAGVVVSGEGFEPGEEVYGEHNGAFAEYVAAPAKVVDRKPANLTFEQAAALPLAATTALQGLKDLGKDDSVLINGASGGVGTFAVQIAKARGARVTAVQHPQRRDGRRARRRPGRRLPRGGLRRHGRAARPGLRPGRQPVPPRPAQGPGAVAAPC